MSAFTLRGLIYAANCTLAALYIAFSFGLPNPGAGHPHHFERNACFRLE